VLALMSCWLSDEMELEHVVNNSSLKLVITSAELAGKVASSCSLTSTVWCVCVCVCVCATT
jgi:hypothetical protein